MKSLVVACAQASTLSERADSADAAGLSQIAGMQATTRAVTML